MPDELTPMDLNLVRQGEIVEHLLDLSLKAGGSVRNLIGVEKTVERVALRVSVVHRRPLE